MKREEYLIKRDRARRDGVLLIRNEFCYDLELARHFDGYVDVFKDDRERRRRMGKGISPLSVRLQ